MPEIGLYENAVLSWIWLKSRLIVIGIQLFSCLVVRSSVSVRLSKRDGFQIDSLQCVLSKSSELEKRGIVRDAVTSGWT